MFEELAKSTPSGLSSGGQNVLWLVFAIFGIASVVYGATGLKQAADKRDHFCTALVRLLSSTMAFSVASGPLLSRRADWVCLSVAITVAVTLTAAFSYFAMVCPLYPGEFPAVRRVAFIALH